MCFTANLHAMPKPSPLPISALPQMTDSRHFEDGPPGPSWELGNVGGLEGDVLKYESIYAKERDKDVVFVQ